MKCENVFWREQERKTAHVLDYEESQEKIDKRADDMRNIKYWKEKTIKL